MRSHFKFARGHNDPDKPVIPPNKGDAPIHHQPVAACPLQRIVGSQDNVVIKCIAAIASNAWKAEEKLVDRTSGEVREDIKQEEVKRIYRHIGNILEELKEMGITIEGHTDTTFDYGLSMKVLTTRPMPGITKEKVIETNKPTIRCQKTTIIQMGEVVIGTPIQKEDKL